jgi:sugar phosphate isomerase/epimerase
MIKWGYAGVFPGEFRIWDGDQTMNKLRFMADNGFVSTGLGGDTLTEMRADPARHDEILGFIQENNLEITLHPPGGYFKKSKDELHREFDAFLEELAEIGPLLRTPIVTFCVGPYHRYMDDPSLERQMDILADVLPPLAAGCAEQGRPLAIENHADYFLRDLVSLCERVPGLGILMDTGNCCVVGEEPVPACRLAAPFTLGTHLKDHKVYPKLKDGLAFIVEGASIGHGHVEIGEILHDLYRLNPHPEKLVMQWELIPPKDIDPWESLRESWEFCRSFEAELRAKSSSATVSSL